jgi:uncharacterized protein (DUF2345 family)
MTDTSGVTGSVTTAQQDQFNTNQDRGTTPKAVNFDGDVRSMEGAGSYPNYWSHKSRSGHSFIMDDSEGKETVTIQHRSGTAIQMKPDGGMNITTNNGRYEVTFGENRVTISGAQDITVKGDASLRVYGDYNVTCHKNYNLTVLGDYNITSKNLNRSIRGNMDTEAKNINKRVEGSSTYNTLGAHSIVAKGNMTMASRTAKTYIGGSSGLHMHVTNNGDMTMKSEQGDMYMETKQGKLDGQFSDGSNKVSMVAESGAFHAQADKAVNVESKQDKIQMKAQQDIGMSSTSGGVNVSATSGNFQVNAGQKVRVNAGSDMQMNASGTAGFQGSETHVGQTAGTTHVVGQAVNVDPSGGLLNLAGGLGIPMPSMGQLPFNFGDILSAQGVQSITAQTVDRPQEEPDASSEIRSWK